MKLPTILTILVAAAPALALAETHDDKAAQTAPAFLPTGVKLVGVEQSTEIRTFPEQEASRGDQKVRKETVVGVNALDRVWTTEAAYADTVRAIDAKVGTGGIQLIAKTVTPTTTAWNLQLPDGHISNAIVRNTQPTTIETVQLVSTQTTTHGATPPGASGK